MKTALSICLLILLFCGCNKDRHKETPATCNIEQVYSDNAKKLTVTNGVWGTVSAIEGDCMSTVPACHSCCRNCPVKRTVKIYKYTTINDAVTNNPYGTFFDSFTTQMIAQVDTDDKGFFQTTIPAGHYSIVVVENGKLYANARDGQGGISSFMLTAGTKNINLTMTYKATF